MSIFKKLGKLAGRAAKIGLGVVTHGVSDKVLGALKSIAAHKKQNAIHTTAAKAMALRYTPHTRVTARDADGALVYATRGAGQVGNTRERTVIDSGNALPGGRSTGTRKRARKAGGVRSVGTRRLRAPVLKVARAKKPRAVRSGAKRAAPASFAKFAARAKELAAQWRAAGGKEGTGQTFFEWKRGK